MHDRDQIPLCVSGQWTLGRGVGVNDYSEPRMVPRTLLCPHGTCLPILPLGAPLTGAALGLRPSSVQAAGWGASTGPAGGCTQGPCANGFGVSEVRLPLQAR